MPRAHFWLNWKLNNSGLESSLSGHCRKRDHTRNVTNHTGAWEACSSIPSQQITLMWRDPIIPWCGSLRRQSVLGVAREYTDSRSTRGSPCSPPSPWVSPESSSLKVGLVALKLQHEWEHHITACQTESVHLVKLNILRDRLGNEATHPKLYPEHPPWACTTRSCGQTSRCPHFHRTLLLGSVDFAVQRRSQVVCYQPKRTTRCSTAGNPEVLRANVKIRTKRFSLSRFMKKSLELLHDDGGRRAVKNFVGASDPCDRVGIFTCAAKNEEARTTCPGGAHRVACPLRESHC